MKVMVGNGTFDLVRFILESIAAMRRGNDGFIIDDRAAAQEVVESDVDDPGPAVRDDVFATNDSLNLSALSVFLNEYILRNK